MQWTEAYQTSNMRSRDPDALSRAARGAHQKKRECPQDLRSSASPDQEPVRSVHLTGAHRHTNLLVSLAAWRKVKTRSKGTTFVLAKHAVNQTLSAIVRLTWQDWPVSVKKVAPHATKRMFAIAIVRAAFRTARGRQFTNSSGSTAVSAKNRQIKWSIENPTPTLTKGMIGARYYETSSTTKMTKPP